MAGKLCPFSYDDGVRQRDHPYDVIEAAYPGLLQQQQQRLNALQPPRKVTGTSCARLIMKEVTANEGRAEAARTKGDTALYHALTYLSDSFIPLLLLAQSKGDAVLPQEHILNSWPSVDKNVMHEGRLPALMHLVLQCCFWSDNSKKSIPIVHILTKGVPKRCQVRSLIDIIDKKQQEDRSLMNFVLDIFNCFSLGGYQHSSVRPAFELRKRIYSNLIFDKKAKNNLRLLFKKKKTVIEIKRGRRVPKEVYENANTVTLAVREYLCICVRRVPALYEVLVERCGWKSFEKDVFQSADRARQLMNENFAMGYFWYTNIDSIVSTKKSNKDSNIYQPIKNAFVSTLLTSMNNTEADHLCSREYVTASGGGVQRLMADRLDPDVRAVITAALSLYREDQEIIVTEQAPHNDSECAALIKAGRFPLVCFGCSSESAAALRSVHEGYKQEERAKFIHALAQQLWKRPIDFALSSFLFQQLQLRSSVRLRPLPLHYLWYQYLAIVRRYGLPEDSSLESVARNYGKIRICMQCKTIRSPVVTPETNKKSFSYYAHGSDHVVVDHVTGKIYCTGKKRDDKLGRSGGGGGSSYKKFAALSKGDNFNPLDMDKAFKKDQKRKLKKEGEARQSRLCRETEISTLYILGYAVDFLDKSYLLCCYCGRLTEYNGRRYYDDAFVCGCCTQETEAQPVSCSICNRKERKRGSFATYKNIINESGDPITIHLCATHNKRWIAVEYEQHSTYPLTMSRILQGYQESWRSVTTASGNKVTISQSNKRRRYPSH